VNVRRRDGTQRRQFCRSLMFIEHVEGPVTNGAAAQVLLLKSAVA
jgi:hypothetical protein